MPLDPAVRDGIAVLVGIERDRQELQAGADPLAQSGGVLANPAGKDQRVQPAHGGRIGSDRLAHLVDKHLERQFGAGIALGGGVLDVSDVTARNPREPGQAAGLDQALAHLGGRELHAIHQVQRCERIQFPVARGVLQA